MTAASRAALPAEVADRYPHAYAVVDVETTGLDPESDRVLQIAVTQLQADGAVERTWSTLLDPGVDPGPVHIHGLTRERLRGAPTFPDVAASIVELLDGRVLVAHNARFDWAFLSREAARCGLPLPVQFRLCTIALSRRLDLPVAALSLKHIADYWGIAQNAAHDAVDDTRVVVEILRRSLAAAARLDARLPLARCAPEGARPPAARTPKAVCPWRNPGRWTAGQPLVQGMKVAFTGETSRPRDELIGDAIAAGLAPMNNVSSQTSVLVRNPGAQPSRKSEAAAAHGTPVIDETAWITLLRRTRPGIPKSAPAHDEPAPLAAPPPPARTAPPSGPLARRRVLVLGGVHVRAAQVRERVVEHGGQAAANLTASVTDVVLFEDAELDQRHARVIDMRLPKLDPETLQPIDGIRPPAAADTGPTDTGPIDAGPTDTSLTNAGPTDVDTAESEPVTLGRGAVIDLPDEPHGWSLAASWPDSSGDQIAVDVVAFVVDDAEQVRADEDFLFYNQPGHASGAVDLELDTANEALVSLKPSMLPDAQRRVVLAAAVDDERTFRHVGPVELALRTAEGRLVARSTLDAATTERSMVLAVLYQRSGVWRFRAVGQGYDAGLEHLAVLHGVDIEDAPS